MVVLHIDMNEAGSVDHQGRVVPLEPGDAWALLPHSGLGRLLYTRSALPAVRLLPFVLCGRTMILALDLPSFDQVRHVIDSVTAVEVDDPQGGWTVTITSEAHEATAVCDKGFTQDPSLARWLDGSPMTYLQIEPTMVSGHKVLSVPPDS